MQIYSDRPASEVFASASASAEQAMTADQTTSAQLTMKLSLPSHHGLMVGDGKVTCIELLKNWKYFQGTAIFDYVPTERGATYVYKPPIVSTYGPGVPDLEELDSYGYESLFCVYWSQVSYSVQ